jgi:hypothetical protein
MRVASIIFSTTPRATFTICHYLRSGSGDVMHTISIDADANLVTVQYQGKVTVAERTEVLGQLLTMLHETQCRKLLVDFRGARSPVEDFTACKDLARRLMALGVQGCQVAYVWPANGAIHPVVDALAASRGFLFEKFEDLGEARQWLAMTAAGGAGRN